jgi:hypothetical protein
MAELGPTNIYGNLYVANDINVGNDVNVGGLMNGIATSAWYADLAENFIGDKNLPIGTVVEISNKNNIEIQPVTKKNSKSVMGVVSEDPAYLMNSQLENGIPIALTGRIKVLIKGKIKKGDFIIPYKNGCAKKGKFWEYKYKIGYSLEDNYSNEIKLVNCFIK